MACGTASSRERHDGHDPIATTGPTRQLQHAPVAVVVVADSRSTAVAGVEAGEDVRRGQAGKVAGGAVAVEAPRSTRAAAVVPRKPEEGHHSGPAEANRTRVGAEAAGRHRSGSARRLPPSFRFLAWRCEERHQRRLASRAESEVSIPVQHSEGSESDIRCGFGAP